VRKYDARSEEMQISFSINHLIMLLIRSMAVYHGENRLTGEFRVEFSGKLLRQERGVQP
jgi:hypothetical protein